MEINEGVKAGTSEWEPASERTHMGICELMHAPRWREGEKHTMIMKILPFSEFVLSSWQTAVERLIRKPQKQQQNKVKKKCTVMNFCLRSLARVCVLQTAKKEGADDSSSEIKIEREKSPWSDTWASLSHRIERVWVASSAPHKYLTKTLRLLTSHTASPVSSEQQEEK